MQSELIRDHLCEVQAELFELSSKRGMDSATFIEKWAMSETAAFFDLDYDRTHWLGDAYLLGEIEDENGEIPRNGESWSPGEMYWIGYMYRRICQRLGISSKNAADFVPPHEMHLIYPGFHTLDCDMAIDRILEERDEQEKSALQFKNC